MRTIQTTEDIISKAKKDVIEIKARQLAGTFNIVPVVNESSNTWDLNQSINLTTSNFIFAYFISETHVAPFAEWRATILLDNVPYNTQTDTRLNRLDFGIIGQALALINPTADELARMSYFNLTLSNPSYPATINAKIKYKVIATDSGTIRVVTGSY